MKRVLSLASLFFFCCSIAFAQSNLDIPKTDILIFPNPTKTGTFTLQELDHKATADFEFPSAVRRVDIYDVLGRRVFTGYLSGTAKKHSLDISGLANGNYMLTYQLEQIVHRKKLVLLQ